MRVLTLNMGNWERKPKVAGGHELPEEFLFQYKLIHNHSSHIICINEAERLTPSMLIDIVDKGFTGIRVTNGDAPAVAIFIRGGSNVTVELLGTISKYQKFAANKGPIWAFFSSLFRIKYGKKYDGEDAMVPYHRHRSGAPATEEQERTIEYQFDRARGFLPRPQSGETSFLLTTGPIDIADASQERLGELILEGKFPSTTTQRLRQTYSHEGTEIVCVRFCIICTEGFGRR